MNISHIISSKNSWGPIYAVGPEKGRRVKYDTGFVAYGSTSSSACFTNTKYQGSISFKINVWSAVKLNYTHLSYLFHRVGQHWLNIGAFACLQRRSNISKYKMAVFDQFLPIFETCKPYQYRYRYLDLNNIPILILIFGFN